MSSYREKPAVIDANQFNSSLPPATWPTGVQTNTLSPTDYSYGTLEVTTDPVGAENMDGFVINDLDWIITDIDGIVTKMSDADFQLKYEPGQ